MGFNLDDYEPVAARLARFVERYPDGAIHTEIVFDDGIRVVVKASAWRNLTDPIPAAVDYAEEILSDRGVNSTSRVENASTSATGRCLALVGFAPSDWTKKPSREEMSKVARAGGVTGGGPTGPSQYATPKQVAYIRRLAADRGLTTEEQVQDAIDAALGQEVLLSQLSPAQASRIIDGWRQ